MTEGIGFEELDGIGEKELAGVRAAAAKVYGDVRAEEFSLLKTAEERGGLGWEALTELAWVDGRIDRFEGRFDELLDMLDRVKTWEGRVAASPLDKGEKTVLLCYASVLRHSSKYWLQLAVEGGDFDDGAARLPEPPKRKCIGRKKRIKMDAAGAALMALDAVNAGKDAEGVQQAAAIGSSVASGGPATV